VFPISNSHDDPLTTSVQMVYSSCGPRRRMVGWQGKADAFVPHSPRIDLISNNE
jgi:hypothetical protein